ncbi:hypothetical protein BCR34DRAFT_626271 [Clohesyomyces aquaticus]|uniref:Short-chain dehydrogenase n=1 Tax=Clohesyomyces aquaticus TaxID=1231657 RepID=A0A1Y1ZD97_9PLEO|nr:hypothetical protein BCR34DRAFT_626271 [Clohesyomyces aquaticus]
MQSILHKVIGPKEVHPEKLDGYIAIVTGGALGIGFEVSRALAETPDAQIEWKECDLGSLAQVQSVFSALASSLGRLDFLVLSAGINTNQYGLDADGIDRHFGVNFLGHFYVCNLLWPLIRKTSKMPDTPAPRVVFEASEMHRMAPNNVHFASLQEINDPDFGPTHLYARTKLAMIIFAKFGLVGKVVKKNEDNIVAVSVNTAMQQQWKDAYPGITGKLLSWTMLAGGRDVEQGSYSALWALTAPEIEEKSMNGWYFSDPGTPGKESSLTSDPALGTALWELSERLIKEKLGDEALVD